MPGDNIVAIGGENVDRNGHVATASLGLIPWDWRVMHKWSGQVRKVQVRRGPELFEVEITCLGDNSLHKVRGDFNFLAEAQCRSDYLFSQYTLARNHEQRDRNLGSMFVYQMDHVTPDPAWVVTSVIRNGKMNKEGRAEFLGVLRHKEPFLCAQFALALTFFIRWEIMGLQRPTFAWAQGQEWEEVAKNFEEARAQAFKDGVPGVESTLQSVVRGRESPPRSARGGANEEGITSGEGTGIRNSQQALGAGDGGERDQLPQLPTYRQWETLPVTACPTKTKDSVKVSYSAVNKRLSRHLEACHMSRDTQPKTHGGRKSGAMKLTAAGLQREALMSFGRWLGTAFDKVYAKKLLPVPLLMQAGFEREANTLRYRMARANVKVPPELAAEVWPWVDKYRWEVSEVSQICTTIELRLYYDCTTIVRNLLRTVFLQDCAVMQDDWGFMPWFQHDVFKTQAWGWFKQRVLQEHALQQRPESWMVDVGGIKES